MKEQKFSNVTIEVFKSLRKIDGFMYDNGAIKIALEQGLTLGKIGIFMLDCIVADQVTTPGAIGKVPLAELEEVVTKSTLAARVGSIKYVADSLMAAGLSVSVWTFIGDDDFKYSVSPQYSVDKLEVTKALSGQIQTLGDHLEAQLPPGVVLHVFGWLGQEENEVYLRQVRDLILESISTGLEKNNLPQKVAQRFSSFVNWRTQLVDEFGFEHGGYADLIKQQATQELTSFVSQGHLTPHVIHGYEPDLPFIFANTFPDLGTQHLDDVCVRLGLDFGLEGYQYGTIHLPGPEKLAKFLGEPKDPSIRPMIFSCGEKIMGQKKGKWQKRG